MVPVLFDLDGTLTDSLPSISGAANVVLEANDLPALLPEIVAGFVGLGEQVFVDRLIDATALAPEDRTQIMELFITAYKSSAAETRCFPGVKDALSELRSRGTVMGVVTNKPRGPLVPTLSAAGLDDFFQVVVAGDDLPTRKPDAAPIKYAMAQLDATDCVFIGDTPVDAATALAAQVPFGLFTEGIRTVGMEDIPYDFAFSAFNHLPAKLMKLGAL